MKLFTYSVLFEGTGEEVVSALGYGDAVILACAKRISAGKHIRAHTVILWENGLKIGRMKINPLRTIVTDWIR